MNPPRESKSAYERMKARHDSSALEQRPSKSKMFRSITSAATLIRIKHKAKHNNTSDCKNGYSIFDY